MGLQPKICPRYLSTGPSRSPAGSRHPSGERNYASEPQYISKAMNTNAGL